MSQCPAFTHTSGPLSEQTSELACSTDPSLLDDPAIAGYFFGGGIPAYASLVAILLPLFWAYYSWIYSDDTLSLLRSALLIVEADQLRAQWIDRSKPSSIVSLRWICRLSLIPAVLALPWLPAVLALHVLVPLSIADPCGHPTSLRRHRLRRSYLILRVAVGLICVYPFWLLDDINDFRHVWPYLLWELAVHDSQQRSSCLQFDQRVYDMQQTPECLSTFHGFQSANLIQATALIVLGNLCLVISAQLDDPSRRWRGLLYRCVPIALRVAIHCFCLSSLLLYWLIKSWHTETTSPLNASEAVIQPLPPLASYSVAPALFGMPVLCMVLVLCLQNGGALLAFSSLYPNELPKANVKADEGVEKADDQAKLTPKSSTWLDASAGEPSSQGDKFCADGQHELIVGRPEDAATGLFEFMEVDEAGVREKLAKGVAAVVEEWQGALRAGDATSSDIENVEYVLAGEAGSSSKRFQHGWIRDRAPDHESSALPERTIHGRGMRLADFENQPQVRTAKLSTAHVFALRLYTTSCYDSINKPLREVKTDKDGEIITPLRLKAPYPLPCTLHLVADGLKRLRATLRTKRTQNPLRPMAENFDSVDAEIPAMETFELEMLSNDANLRSSLLQPTKWRDHLGQRLRSLLGGGSGLPAPLESSQKVWDGGKRRASVKVLGRRARLGSTSW